MKLNPADEPSPVVILAIEILEDVSELCEQMAVLNRHNEGPTYAYTGIPGHPPDGVH
jgi:hypothetical protein